MTTSEMFVRRRCRICGALRAGMAFSLRRRDVCMVCDEREVNQANARKRAVALRRAQIAARKLRRE